MSIYKSLASFLWTCITLLHLTLCTSINNTYVYNELYESSSFNKSHLHQLKQEAQLLFLHGYEAYMEHGFPEDEVRPLSCVGYGPNLTNPTDLRNDVLGGYSVTLLDSIDTFIIMNDRQGFLDAAKLVKEKVTFDVDSTVQVFETAIRALGSLLTCHLYASDPTKGFQIQDYDNYFLVMAYDLGLRLLPAYDTKSGIPRPRINLRHGLSTVDRHHNSETNTAGATTPMLEMTLLSKLTGDSSFEKASRNAFFFLWESRTKLDLLPTTLDVDTERWVEMFTGIGASIDSFYEYALKGAILFDDSELLNVWDTSYKALLTFLRNDWLFVNVNAETGGPYTLWIDSLSAFFPGLQVLAGKVADATYSHSLFLKIWNTFGALPERWSFQHTGTRTERIINLEWYPLRPEFIESTYYLYRATKDPLYLQIGVRILRDFRYRFKTKCGFSGLQDIRTNEAQNRMESFVLSESLKYLYLLFDENNPLHKDKSNIIFTTEGHPLWLDKSMVIPYDEAPVEETEDVQDTGFFETLGRFSRMFAKEDFMKLFRNLYSSNRQLLRKLHKERLEAKLNRIPMNGLEKYGLVTEDRDFHGLTETCQNLQVKSMFSELLSWDRFFEIDGRYKHSLRSPEYLISQNYSPIELDPSFYSRWSNPRKSVCKRRPTCEAFELIFGEKETVRHAQVDRINVKSSKYFDQSAVKVKPGDFWVPLLQGVRIRMETLLPNKVDSNNNVVTPEYVAQTRKNSMNMDPLEIQDLDGSCDAGDSPKVLKVLVLNGQKVDPTATIWVLEAALLNRNKKKLPISLGKDRRVILKNDPIENIFVF